MNSFIARFAGALGAAAVRDRGGLHGCLRVVHGRRLGRRGGDRIHRRLGLVPRERRDLRRAVAVAHRSGAESPAAPRVAAHLRRADARPHRERRLGLQRAHRKRDLRLLARRALHFLLPARGLGVRAAVFRSRRPRSARRVRSIDFTTRGHRLRLAAVVHRAGAARRPCRGDELMENWSVVGYGIGDAIAIIAGAMVAMQITDWREERPIVWLLIAMVVTLVADLLWVNAELRGTYVIGGAQRRRLLRVLPVHVRGRALSARSPPAGRVDARACRATCAARCRIVALMVGTIALLDDRLQLASGQSPLLICGAGRGHAAGGREPGTRHARSGRPASRGRHAPLRRAPDRAGAPLERHDRDLRHRRRHPLRQPVVRAVARRGARRARRPASR